MNDGLKVTVITACYNYGDFFEEYIESLATQKRRPDNIVIIDDASTDDTVKKIQSVLPRSMSGERESEDGKYTYEKYRYRNMSVTHIICKENGGPSIARNIGMEFSIEESDIFAILDMDDKYYPEKISKSIDIFKKYPHVFVVCSDYNNNNTQTNTKNREFKEPYSHKRLTQECIVGSGSLFVAKAIKDLGGYDPELRVAEDYDLWLRISDKAVIYHVAEPLYEYRTTGRGATFSVQNETWQRCWKRVYDKMIERKKNENS